MAYLLTNQNVITRHRNYHFCFRNFYDVIRNKTKAFETEYFTFLFFIIGEDKLSCGPYDGNQS